MLSTFVFNLFFLTLPLQGNPIDISQVKGYEVDDDVWVRGPQPA